MRHVVIIEETETGYSAYVPDLRGCVFVGGNRYEISRSYNFPFGWNERGRQKNSSS